MFHKIIVIFLFYPSAEPFHTSNTHNIRKIYLIRWWRRGGAL